MLLTVTHRLVVVQVKESPDVPAGCYCLPDLGDLDYPRQGFLVSVPIARCISTSRASFALGRTRSTTAQLHSSHC